MNAGTQFHASSAVLMICAKDFTIFLTALSNIDISESYSFKLPYLK
jgi:hypothetical protein